MFGAQNVLPACPTLLNTLPSVLMAEPIACINVGLKECEVVITCGNDVALGVGGANVTPGEPPTPWRASDHHSYAGKL